MSSSAELTGLDRLALAVGRVAIESARNDDFLRQVIQAMMTPSFGAWLLVEAQSTDWLCKSLPKVLEIEDGLRRKWPQEVHDDLTSAVKRIDKLRDLRNTVVHGTWTKGIDPIDMDDITSRPYDDCDDQPSWTATGSRYRKFSPAQEWKISDIDQLADELRDAGQSLIKAYGRMDLKLQIHTATASPPRYPNS